VWATRSKCIPLSGLNRNHNIKGPGFGPGLFYQIHIFMKPFNPLFLLVLTLLLASGCAGREEDSHTWKSADIDFYLNSQANLLTETVVRETFRNWGEHTHFDFHYRGRNRAGIRKDGKNTVSFLVRWPEDIPISKVGYCRTWYDRRGRIVEADIIFNMQVARFTTLRTNTPDSYYLEGVLTHEIGHMIGLDHIDDPSSCMKPKSSAEESYLRGEIDPLTLRAYRELYSMEY